ncbi:hypothetical protein TYRP_015321 [Tyrophagus putrescentiae]|nr:hypothetical protein TYRP_015321 [Tyrophagus putrescentiae]
MNRAVSHTSITTTTAFDLLFKIDALYALLLERLQLPPGEGGNGHLEEEHQQAGGEEGRQAEAADEEAVDEAGEQEDVEVEEVGPGEDEHGQGQI